MNFNKYQEISHETAEGLADGKDVSGKAEQRMKVLFLATAINGEAGELAEKAKKCVREDDDSYLDDALLEIGDVLWYMAQFATLLDEDLNEIAEANLEKLLDRQRRDEIFGEGDHR